jgi:GH43 family beta-xylosidase
MKNLLFIFCFASTLLFRSYAQQSGPGTFTNPVLSGGPDPWVIYQDGFYYYTNSTGNRLELWKTKTMPDLATAPHKTIWRPPVNTSYSKNIWAPELHFLKDKWYMYFAADDGHNANHRLYVLENSSHDPLEGEWILKGQVGDQTNKWAIDGSVFENHGQLYMIWSGWEGEANGQQNIYIAKMENPYTITGERVKVSSPEFEWEKFGDLHDANNPPHVNVNEGPEILQHGNKLFLVYSASGCWTDHYALGMLTAKSSANLMDPKSWKKSAQPVFQTSKENSVYAPGHNSFFKSPNGKEDWIIYHANPAPGCGCGNKRSPRMQKITWKKDGSPDFGIPVKIETPLPVPAAG